MGRWLGIRLDGLRLFLGGRWLGMCQAYAKHLHARHMRRIQKRCICVPELALVDRSPPDLPDLTAVT